jgi:hypothetical protein
VIVITADDYLNIKNILDILFKVTKKSANILADAYLLKDVSTISKWKNNKVVIKSEDINKIVQFAVKESSIVQREMIRKEIEVLINNSGLNASIKKVLFNVDDFGKFIEEALNVSTSLCDNGSTSRIKNTSPEGIYMDKKAFCYDIYSCSDEMKFNLFLSGNNQINIRVVLETRILN